MPGLGLGTRVQDDPSQCWMTVQPQRPQLLLIPQPTAQTSVLLSASMASSWAFWASGMAGVLTSDHAEPFQCMAIGVGQYSHCAGL
jgi:hypothetical protein